MDIYDQEVIDEIKEELLELSPGEKKEIFGELVIRSDDSYIVKGKKSSLTQTAEYLYELAKNKIIKSPKNSIPKEDRAIELLEEAKEHILEAEQYLEDIDPSYTISDYGIDDILEKIEEVLNHIKNEDEEDEEDEEDKEDWEYEENEE